ncbi:hypothetical protein Pint_36048 [Pistacia integerrima]|uniref:Uncharacterized protein n=1 Tax=Pistacia integerrima TaxID=434235 RepID=A0ACC0Y3S8_9ROSI|nr:hypothetical protein Pint_36048 [Pistacia integerrima]
MVGGFAKVGDFINCFGTFREFIRCGMQLDNYTLPSVIRSCRERKDLVMGRLIHDIVLKSGLSVDHFVCAALVDMYAKCGAIDDARELFDKMSNRDLVTWTVMIGACGECGNANESLVLFDRMREEGLVPDKVAMVSVVHACVKLGAMTILVIWFQWLPSPLPKWHRPVTETSWLTWLERADCSYAVLQRTSSPVSPVHSHPHPAEHLFFFFPLPGAFEVAVFAVSGCYNNGQDAAYPLAAFSSAKAGTVSRLVFLPSEVKIICWQSLLT